MLLAIDIGNTHTVIGLIEGTELRARWRLTSDAQRTADEFGILVRQLCAQSGVEISAISGVAVSSVVPAMTTAFAAMAEELTGAEPLIVGPNLDLGIVLDHKDPSEVGADRIANAVAAREMFDGPVIVVDFGTATTFDVVTADGHYAGGAIAPGVRTSAETLFGKAALLHRVSLDPPPSVIGRSTDESLRSGIIFGAAGQVDEIVRRISEEMGAAPTIVATGGLAEKMALSAKSVNVVEPDLTLYGLAILYRRNRQ